MIVQLVLVRRPRVSSTCLLIVMLLAKRLPVAPVPKKLLITTVRDDVIHYRGFHELPFLAALGAQRVVQEELF